MGFSSVVNRSIYFNTFSIFFQDFTKKREQEISTNKANQETLVNYQDRMSELLQKGLLKTTNINSDIFIIAQAKTVTVLQSLDPERQHLIIQFLDASKLSIQPGSFGILYQAKMSKAKLTGADLSDAQLSSVNLSNATLDSANLSNANLNNAILSGSNLENASLSGANLGSANLSGANLSNVDLSKIDLSNAILIGVQFRNTNLRGADLSGANLSNVDFSNGVNLENAKLQGAKFINTNLRNVSLKEADLTGADFSGSNFNEALLCKTILKNGKTDDKDCLKLKSK